MFEDFATFRAAALSHADQFRRYATDRGMPQLAARIEKFEFSLDQTRYNIAIIGSMKRGKSTLLNAILGRSDDDVSPIDEKVCTAGIVQYIDTGDSDAKERGFVFFEDRPDAEEIRLQQIREFVTEERNPENEKKVRRVEVHGHFPLLNKSVTLVDTPGRGAVNEHHETLVEQFLPNADAIIFPIDASNPIDASERQFLELLSEQDKDRIFFVLTKYDALDPGDREEVENWVRSQIEKVGLTCDRLHKVAAREVFEARKSGKSESEVSSVINSSGVADLERELEAFILKTSSKNDAVRRRVGDVLDECNSFCRTEIDRLEGEIKSFDLDVVQLEADRNSAKEAAEKLRAERDKSLRLFEKRWDKRISRFEQDLSRHSDRISDAIVDRLRGRGFIKTLADSTKFGGEVARRVDSEITPTVLDLGEQLSAIVAQLHEELDEQLEVYRKRCSLTSFQTSIVAASGGAVVAGAGFLGASTVTSAFASANAAWAAVAATGSTATGTAANVGVVQATLAWFFGAPVTASTNAAATAATANAAATSAAIAASATTIAVAGGAIAGVYIAKRITHWGVAALQENKVPSLVESALRESAEQVVQTLGKRREHIAEEYSEVIDGLIENQEIRMQQIIDSINANDPAEKEKRIERKSQLEEFLAGNARLEVKMAELPKLGEL